MKQRFIIPAYVLVICITCIAGAERFINQPSDGTVTQTQPVASPVVEQVPVQGKYVRFTYPNTFTPTPIDKPVAPVLEDYSFIKRQANPWTISVAVSRLATGSLSDDSSFNYRQKTPGRFTRSDQTIADQSVIVFTDVAAEDFSRTAYLQHGAMDAAITISGSTSGDGAASINNRLTTLVGSWQWQ